MRVWHTIRAASLDWHRHDAPYADLVLAAGYEEAGDHGRFQVKPGDVLSHEPFEAHVDRFPVSGAMLLNLSLPGGCSFTGGAAKVRDPDLIARTAEKSCAEAAGSQALHASTDWELKPSLKYDALCLLNVLNGNPRQDFS